MVATDVERQGLRELWLESVAESAEEDTLCSRGFSWDCATMVMVRLGPAMVNSEKPGRDIARHQYD